MCWWDPVCFLSQSVSFLFRPNYLLSSADQLLSPKWWNCWTKMPQSWHFKNWKSLLQTKSVRSSWWVLRNSQCLLWEWCGGQRGNEDLTNPKICCTESPFQYNHSPLPVSSSSSQHGWTKYWSSSEAWPLCAGALLCQFLWSLRASRCRSTIWSIITPCSSRFLIDFYSFSPELCWWRPSGGL